MSDMLSVAVLPIGEFDFPSVKTEYEGILAAFERLGADLIIADPAVDETEAQRSAQGLMEHKPDLLLLVPLPRAERAGAGGYRAGEPGALLAVARPGQVRPPQQRPRPRGAARIRCPG